MLFQTMNLLPALVWMSKSGITRTDFIKYSLIVPQTILFEKVDSVSLPIRFLPTAGCLAIEVQVGGQPYLAILDTGSPFLTAPDSILRVTEPENDTEDSSEQYGDAVGSMQWRRGELHIPGTSISSPATLGIPDGNILAESGGIYLGLMYDDDHRPTVLRQIGFQSFRISYTCSTMTLFSGSSNEKRGSPMDMFNLGEYCKNLHHYAVRVKEVVFRLSNGNVHHITGNKRPIVAVIDTGLTGMILSDSFKEILPYSVSALSGAKVKLADGPRLSSNDDYWFPAMIRLPWFPEGDETHPHIIGLGGSFLKSTNSIDVDTVRRKIWIT